MSIKHPLDRMGVGKTGKDELSSFYEQVSGRHRTGRDLHERVADWSVIRKEGLF